MSAEVLRQAAALMRERAEAATTHTPWQFLGLDDEYAPPFTVASTHPLGDRTYVCTEARHAGDHIASWHPAVALAVAGWLEEAVGLVDAIADYREGFIKPPEGVVRLADHALAVARAYLRADS